MLTKHAKLMSVDATKVLLTLSDIRISCKSFIIVIMIIHETDDFNHNNENLHFSNNKFFFY